MPEGKWSGWAERCGCISTWPLQGSASESTGLLDYSLDFDLDLFLSGFKDKDLLWAHAFPFRLLDLPCFDIRPCFIVLLIWITCLSHIFVACSTQVFKLFIFSSAREEVNCIHSDVGFTRKGKLKITWGPLAPANSEKTWDFIFLEFSCHCFLFVSDEPKLSKPCFPFNTFLLYRCPFFVAWVSNSQQVNRAT